MSFVADIVDSLVRINTELISFFGYSGVVILMVFESMIFPVPSELVMPFAGFLVAQGKLNFFLVVVASIIGSLIGSLISYYIGMHGGNRLLKRYGKYVLLDVDDLMKAEKWFHEKGDKTVFLCRFVPIIRHFISIPAGIGKMNIKKFILYTALGAGIWNTFLAYLGYLLGQNWRLVREYADILTIIFGVVIVVGGIYFVYKHIHHKRRKHHKAE